MRAQRRFGLACALASLIRIIAYAPRVCTKQGLRSDCASALSDLSIRRALCRFLRTKNVFERTAKILVSLHRCAGDQSLRWMHMSCRKCLYQAHVEEVDWKQFMNSSEVCVSIHNTQLLEFTNISYLPFDSKWAGPCGNVSSGICGQRRPRSACAFAQSDQDRRSPLSALRR